MKQPRRDAEAPCRRRGPGGCIGIAAGARHWESARLDACFRVEACVGPHPAGTEIAARARTVTRARVLRRKAGVRISAAPLSRSLALSPKSSGAAAPYRASRATIALPESDRPDGREPAMPLPRTQPSCRGRADDCMARMMRKSNGAGSSSEAALLLLQDIGLLVRHDLDHGPHLVLVRDAYLAIRAATPHLRGER